MGEGGSDKGAAVAVGDGDRVLGPVAGERLDGVSGHTALLLGPLRGLGDAVLPAHDVVGEVLEADRVGVQVLLVVGSLTQPCVCDSKLERRIGVGQNGDPFIGVNRIGVVNVRRDINLFHPDIGEPVAQAAGHHAAPAPRRRLRIGAPEKDGIAIFGNVFDDIVL